MRLKLSVAEGGELKKRVYIPDRKIGMHTLEELIMDKYKEASEKNQDFNVYESDENYEIEPTEQPHEKVSSVLTSLTVIRDELKDSATIPFWLISKCFTFEKVDNHLILKNINIDYWNAVRLYTLLLYKYRELGEKRMHVSIRFMTKGLGIHYTQLINALDILRKGKFIKTRKEGQKLHAIKHYVSMLKVT